MLNLLALLFPSFLVLHQHEAQPALPVRRAKPHAHEAKAHTADLLNALKQGRSVDLLVKLGRTANHALRPFATPAADVFAATKSSIRSLENKTDFEIVEDFSHLPVVAVRLSSEGALAALLALNEVDSFRPPQVFHANLAESLPLISQPPIAGAGYLGAGTTVAVLDTGVDYTHPAFGSCSAPNTPSSCRVVFAQDFAPEDGLRDDAATGFHGTNVAAIVTGVAPGARIAALDVFTGSSVSETTAIAAINWSIANRAVYNIVAINGSFGATGNHQIPCDDIVGEAVVQSALSAGLLLVAASGNEGNSLGMGPPACLPGVVSVGAVYDANVGAQTHSACSDPTSAADRVACFSNGASYLTVLAPGANITAGGQTFRGTSQAAPHVAGAIAVIRSASPTEGVASVLSRIAKGGTQVADPRTGSPKPRLNVLGAANVTSFGCSSSVISCGQVITSTLRSSTCQEHFEERVYYFDWFEFEGTVGQTVTLELNSSSFYPYLRLLSPSGTAYHGGSQLAQLLTETGTWQVFVSSDYAGETGSYSLRLTSCSTAQPSTCTASSSNLCLNASRFRVQVTWRVPSQGTSGTGTAIPLSGDTGIFWFFNSANVELVVKVLDGRSVNGRFWVFYGALSDVEYTIIVTDTATGAVRTYSNPQGRLASNADTSAF